ncbi:Stk1 family PASTA domain-containing Ser/Thr kinase [Clostridium sp.]|uniref:Stk1 family PASTA domain-containing Ser/Thr kinase n=1 Tax=Clostridium sp. TaxID=1506 RepID=UPI001A61C238|nr:Stk1 family PASTA domain-containing Ser/Thr kinase [Clostridium sp.]MBK5242330.1 Stk1 family PASTA domain-containing Ser/Thr kinase [Clostridium sp.]
MIGKLLLNRYELLEKIGEGGMGIVYKAKCHLLNRIVAVKVLKAELCKDEEFVARFKREATSAARLSHPNIVNVHDVGEDNDVNFIVMEYINGKTLKQIIKENGRISSQRTVEIALQISSALDCAHKNNIIHRDIKPDNILITADNIVKVADFGIAKVADSRTVTNSNKIIGTAHYFSPEQAKGNFVDGRTDIYSLGIVMYEMITGKVPYDADSSITIAMMHIQEPVIPPIEINADIPENINGVILKAIEKEPMNRYKEAKKMAEILSAIKKNPYFKLEPNNRPSDATKIMSAVVGDDIGNDFTTVMSQQTNYEKPIVEEDKILVSGRKSPSKNKKIMIIIATVLLVMIIAVLGKDINKGKSNDAQTTIAKETTPKVTEKPVVEKPVVEKKFVPSVIGSTQEVATKIVIDNGFLLGTILYDYSDSLAMGLVISQTPNVNTSYEKGGKIDLVISQGKEVAKVTVPDLKGKSLDDAKDILEDIKLELGEQTAVKVKAKGKDKHSKDQDEIIFEQDSEPDALVDIGTKINVSYYES